MATTTAPTRPVFASPPEVEHRNGLRLTTATYQRRPWQIGLGVALVLVCAAVAGAVFESSAKRVSIVVAGKNLAAGTVLIPGDLATATIPASGDITAMSAAGSTALVGQQLDTPVYAGQVMVRQMLSTNPQLAVGEQVVGMLMKGDQIPSVPLVAGDAVQVIAVPQPGQGSTVGGTIGSTLVARATVFAVGPAPTNQTQYETWISLEVPRADAATITAYAAADQIGLSLVSEGQE